MMYNCAQYDGNFMSCRKSSLVIVYLRVDRLCLIYITLVALLSGIVPVIAVKGFLVHTDQKPELSQVVIRKSDVE